MKATLLLQGLLLFGFAQTANASDLDWLVGCWETPDKSSMEVWVKDTDDDLIGFSVSVADDKVVFYEVLRISISDDGSATYSAHPAGQSHTLFTAAIKSGSEVKFTNPSHDYPQVIWYKRDGSFLYATISGLQGEDPRSFNKQACE